MKGEDNDGRGSEEKRESQSIFNLFSFYWYIVNDMLWSLPSLINNKILFDLNVQESEQKGDNKRRPTLKIRTSPNEKTVPKS